ncbi:MAG: hypothetical protein ABJC07_09735 [Acidobacteriota bacterium]
MKLCPACRRCFPETARACVEPGHPMLIEGPPVASEIADTWVLERLITPHPEGGLFVGRSRKTGSTATVFVRRAPAPEEETSFDLFRRESVALATLQESSIAGVEEFGSLGSGGAYAVLAPPGDETLRDALQRDGRFPIPAALSVGRQVAEAADALARSGISPGEFAPDRVGLRRRDSGQLTVRVVRIPGAGDGISAPGSEIFSIGALLYEMLSGKPLESGMPGNPPPPIQRARPDVTEPLGWLVMQCLHPNPRARPRSLGEIVERIRALEATDVVAAPQSRPQPFAFHQPLPPSRPAFAFQTPAAYSPPAPPPPDSDTESSPRLSPAEDLPEPPAVSAASPPAPRAEKAGHDGELPGEDRLVAASLPEASEPEVTGIASEPAAAAPPPPEPPRDEEEASPPPRFSSPTPDVVSDPSSPADLPPEIPEETPPPRLPEVATPAPPLALLEVVGPATETLSIPPENPAEIDAAVPPAEVEAAPTTPGFELHKEPEPVAVATPPRDTAVTAITAEIPILRPRYSFGIQRPEAPEPRDDGVGPRPMFLEDPPEPESASSPLPPPPPSRGLTPWPSTSQSAALDGRHLATPKRPRPPESVATSPFRSRPPAGRPFTAPAAPWSTTRPAATSSGMREKPGPPARQIPISAELRQRVSAGAPSRIPAPAEPELSRVSGGKEKLPREGNVSPDSGVGEVAIGSLPENTAEFEKSGRGPRAGLVWGVVAVIAAAVLGAFWLVIEATPPRHGARVAAGPTAIPQTSQPMPAPPGPAAPPSVRVPAVEPPGDVVSAPPDSSSGSPALREASAASRPDHAAGSPGPAIAGHERVSPNRREPPRVASPGAEGLRDALDAWIASTNTRDLSGHMRFYLPQVRTFYLTRNVSREFVRGEKARLFRGGPVSVDAEEPEIDPSPDGRTATVRFRKRYAVSGARGEKRGEVLQEMTWVRTPQGWRIAGERDAKVLASR